MKLKDINIFASGHKTTADGGTSESLSLEGYGFLGLGCLFGQHSMKHLASVTLRDGILS